MEVGVGYPDNWAGLFLAPGRARQRLREQAGGRAARYTQQLAKAGKPQDRREWWMNAQLVNAVNLPVQNALNFPAAILQKPFFDPKADAAFNYGAVGAVIGHEISHSFDNNGARSMPPGRCATGGPSATRRRFERGGRGAGRAVRRLSNRFPACT